MSERLGPVPADLQAWAKRASVVTTVSRKREARWDLFCQHRTETKFFQEKVPQQITDCQKEKWESWEGDEDQRRLEEKRQEPGPERQEKPVVASKEESVANKD